MPLRYNWTEGILKTCIFENSIRFCILCSVSGDYFSLVSVWVFPLYSSISSGVYIVRRLYFDRSCTFASFLSADNYFHSVVFFSRKFLCLSNPSPVAFSVVSLSKLVQIFSLTQCFWLLTFFCFFPHLFMVFLLRSSGFLQRLHSSYISSMHYASPRSLLNHSQSCLFSSTMNSALYPHIIYRIQFSRMSYIQFFYDFQLTVYSHFFTFQMLFFFQYIL